MGLLLRRYLRLLLAGFLLSVPLVALAAPQRYDVDLDRSRVSFDYQMGEQTSRGYFPMQAGDVVLNLANVAQSRVEVVLSTAGVRAGDLFATAAMKSRDVLDADRFPTARFVSQTVAKRPEGALVTGALTLRGVTRAAAVDVRILRHPDAPADNSELILEISGQLRRSDFGATGYADMVGDLITLRFYVWLSRASP